MIIQEIVNLILNDEQIGKRVREILREQLRDDGDILLVYVSPPGGGHCYHTNDCTLLQGKGKEIPFEIAKHVGYIPCTFCKP